MTTTISDSQKQFIISSIKNDFRIDGRTNNQPQKIGIKINNLQHLLGSCLLNVQQLENQVHIYTGIKIKLQKQQKQQKQQSRTSTNLQLKPIKNRVTLQLGCIKKLTQQQQQTRLYLEEYLNKYIVASHLQEFQQLLKISQAKRHYLTINIEAYILSSPHISYLEYLFICVKTAIRNIQIPQFQITFNEVTDEEIVEVKQREKNIPLNSDTNNNQSSSLVNRQKVSPYQGLQTLKIVGVIGQNYVIGMTVEEYDSVDSCVLVAFGNDKKVTAFQSLKGTLKVQEIHQIIKFARY